MVRSTDDLCLLIPEEMALADQLAIAGGVPGIVLMENAGRAVAEAASSAFPEARRIAALAGPGNNGGDAYVAARHLRAEGRDVTIFALDPNAGLKGDAAVAASGWGGAVQDLRDFDADAFDLVLDGLFGAGLARPVEGRAAQVIEAVNRSRARVVAIDLPSGVSGKSGAVMGTAFKADVTVTFFRRKPGHLLHPGRGLCGHTILADIGIPASVLPEIGAEAFANEPALWPDAVAAPQTTGHKYGRGHAVVFSGSASKTGAARLAAVSALRAGAGLVTIFSPASAMLVNAGALTAVMLKRCEDGDELGELIADERFNAFALGPGFGVGEKARVFVAAILRAGRHLVLDADGITSFADDPAALFSLARASGGGLVLTPHAGEFRRLFPQIADDEALSKLEKARGAASASGAVVILKGADTVIATPDGRAAINATGTPWLATAGTGDVLAGIIAGLLAQGAEPFDAAAAAVWMHGKAAELFGPGLISEDLPEMLPQVWGLLEEKSRA
ncbi:NAD(P)H-hydrate dehydratase [Consotaella aegiceratis]|uniref:NAD(P)H-hydrate dehydratase n=1 Tax=Consotaella aegiceratis TaxID=3097961 RepID=UPI002F40AA98